MVVVVLRLVDVPHADVRFGASIPSLDIHRVGRQQVRGVFDGRVEVAEFQLTLNEVEQERTTLRVQVTPIVIVRLLPEGGNGSINNIGCLGRKHSLEHQVLEELQRLPILAGCLVVFAYVVEIVAGQF